MYKCLDCNNTFIEPSLVDEGFHYEYWGECGYHQIIVDKCPYCGSEDIEEYDEEEK